MAELSSQSDHLNPDKESSPKRSLWIGFLLLIALSLIWGFAWPVMKSVLIEVPPWTFRLYCTVFGGAGFIVLIKLLGFPLKIPKKDFKPVLISSFFNITLWFIFSAYAIANMNAGRASIIAYTMPLWAAVMSGFFLRERLTVGRFAGLFLGIAGIAILIGPDIIVFKTAPIGTIFMLCAAIGWGAGVVTVKYHKWSMPTIVLSCWLLIIGGMPLVVGAIVIETSAVFAPVSFMCFLALVYVVILGNIFSYWAWFKIISIFPVTVASIGILLVPIIGVFSSALMLGESVGFREIVALVLVVSALVIVLILPEVLKDKSVEDN